MPESIKPEPDEIVKDPKSPAPNELDKIPKDTKNSEGEQTEHSEKKKEPDWAKDLLVDTKKKWDSSTEGILLKDLEQAHELDDKMIESIEMDLESIPPPSRAREKAIHETLTEISGKYEERSNFIISLKHLKQTRESLVKLFIHIGNLIDQTSEISKLDLKFDPKRPMGEQFDEIMTKLDPESSKVFTKQVLDTYNQMQNLQKKEIKIEETINEYGMMIIIEKNKDLWDNKFIH